MVNRTAKGTFEQVTTSAQISALADAMAKLDFDTTTHKQLTQLSGQITGARSLNTKHRNLALAFKVLWQRSKLQ